MSGDLGTSGRPHRHWGEQLNLQPRTEDPNDPVKGEAWIRSDLGTGDEIGIFRFFDGEDNIDLSILDLTASEPEFEEVLQLPIDGTVGYIPALDPNDAKFPELRFRHNGQTFGLGGFAIPDSEDLHSHHDPTQDVTQSNGTVTALGDLSGNNNDVTGTATGLSTINGVPAINFSPQDELDTDITDISPPYHVFIVLQYDDLSDTGSNYAFYGQDSGTPPSFREADGNFVMAGATGDLTPSTYDTDPHIWEWLWSDNGDSTVIVDGSEEASGDIGTVDMTRIEYGNRTGFDVGSDMRLGEVLTYNMDKSGVASQARDYLSDKWGVSLD